MVSYLPNSVLGCCSFAFKADIKGVFVYLIKILMQRAFLLHVTDL